MGVEEQKLRAAQAALEQVEPGMRLGLGSGSTAAIFVDLLGAKVKAGLDVVGVATSETTRAQADALGIRLSSLDDLPFLDLAIDGTDEIDSEMRLIKGGGGALLREKIVANASDRMIVIADSSKRVDMLGAFKLPLEVVRFGIHVTRNMIEVLANEAGCEGQLVLRRDPDGTPFVTDNGNLILDADFKRIPEPEMLAAALQMIPGLVDHGLFLGLADLAIIGTDTGVEILEAEAMDDEDADDDRRA